MDTDMARGVQGPKASPGEVVRQVFDALEQGRDEVLADALTRQVEQGVSAERGVYQNATSD